jgi:hypothetical protein
MVGDCDSLDQGGEWELESLDITVGADQQLGWVRK